MNMRKLFLAALLAALVCVTATAQKKFSAYAVGFYNQ